ncbi:hypothetical protein ACIOML_23430 [Streptomyces anulatus]
MTAPFFEYVSLLPELTDAVQSAAQAAYGMVAVTSTAALQEARE